MKISFRQKKRKHHHHHEKEGYESSKKRKVAVPTIEIKTKTYNDSYYCCSSEYEPVEIKDTRTEAEKKFEEARKARVYILTKYVTM